MKLQLPGVRAAPAIPDLPPLPPAGLPYRMGLNECPMPLPEPVRDAIVAAISETHRYPDHASTALVDDLASMFGVPPDHIVVGPGLVGLCRSVVHMTACSGDEVVIPWPSFDDYLLDAVLYGAVPVRVPLRRHHIDVAALLDAVTDRTRLVFISSPNNPTGTLLSREELTKLLTAIPPDVVVVLDEAYAEFADLAPGRELYPAHPNLCVLRTFSKAYGLAGLRIGYAVTRPPLAGPLREYVAPFSVSNIAQAAARAALAHRALYADRIARLVAERRGVTAALRTLGWQVVDSQANFLWLPVGPDSVALGEELASAGISVRSYPDAGIRVTVGTAGENRHLLRTLARHSGYPAVRSPGD